MNYAEEKSRRGFGDSGFRDGAEDYSNDVRNSGGYDYGGSGRSGVSGGYSSGGNSGVTSGPAGGDTFSSNDHAGEDMPGVLNDPERG